MSDKGQVKSDEMYNVQMLITGTRRFHLKIKILNVETSVVSRLLSDQCERGQSHLFYAELCT